LVLVSIAVLLRIVSNPIANVYQKQLTYKQHHPLLVSFLTYLLLSIVCVPFLNIMPWREFPKEFWVYSILGGIAGALGNGFLVKALQRGELSVLGPINSYKSVVGVVFGIFLLGEIPNLWGLLGIVLIIYGSYYILDTTEGKFSLALLKKRGIVFRISAVILTAIEAVFIKKVILVSSTTIAFISWCWMGAIFSFVLLFIYRLDIKDEIRKIGYTDFGRYALLILCIGTMQFTTNYVLKYIDVGYALSFFQLSILVSVILGGRYFNEQNIQKKLVGSAIMIVGAIVIILLRNNMIRI
jgi:drug/metabolite transporter (DMT)-like permease